MQTTIVNMSRGRVNIQVCVQKTNIPVHQHPNVWKRLAQVAQDNSSQRQQREKQHSCACSTLHSTGESCCEFFNTYIHTYTYIYIHTYIYTQNVWYSWFPKILRCGTFNFAASTISSTSRGLRIDTQIEFLKAEGEEAVRWKLEVVGICRSVSKCLGPNFRDFQSASVLGEHHTWDPLEHHWLVIWAWLKWWPTEDSYRESTRNLGFLGSIHIPQRGITPINQPLIGQYKSYIIHI